MRNLNTFKITEPTLHEQFSLVLFTEHAQRITTFLDNLPNVNELSNDTGRSFLMLACVNGSELAVNTLIEKGAQIDAQDSGGYNALYYAILYKHTPIALRLIQAGANAHLKNHQGDDNLMVAIAQDQLEVFIAMVEAGADILSKNSNGRQPHRDAAYIDKKPLFLEYIDAITLKQSLEQSPPALKSTQTLKHL